jgi:hypothetical protein
VLLESGALTSNDHWLYSLFCWSLKAQSKGQKSPWNMGATIVSSSIKYAVKMKSEPFLLFPV